MRPGMQDESQVRALVEAAGIGGRKLTIAPIPGGTINQAFRLDGVDDGPLILRVAPSDADVAPGPSWLTSHGLRREQEVLPLLADLDDLLPRTVHFDDSRTLLDRDWVIQTMVPGQPWIALRPSLDARDDQALWRELGELAARIHAVEGAEFGPPEVGFGTATWAELLRWDATGFVVDAGRYGFDSGPMDALCALIDRSVPLLEQIERPRLIHSDLTLDHVFVATGRNGRHRISGLIDFEFGRFADPFSESVFVAHALDPATDDAFASFCEGYACPPFTSEDALRLRIYHLVSLGWEITDLVRRRQHDQVPALMSRMQDLLDQAERSV